MLTKKILTELGQKYCERRPGSTLVSVDVKNRKIVTCYCGCYITSDADKVAKMFGIELEKESVA